MNPSRAPAARGFTLLELVVVLAVFGLVAVMAYGGLNNVLRARVAIEDNLERVTALQRAYLRLREDFQQVQPRTIRDEFGEPLSALLGMRDEGVSLVSGGWRNPAGHPRSTMQRIRWNVEDDSLVRSHFRFLDRAQDAQAQKLVVLDGVDRMQLRYLGGDREWYAEWPPDITRNPDLRADATPPLAVEMTLATDDWGELVLLFPTGSQYATLGSGDGSGAGAATGGGGFGRGPGGTTTQGSDATVNND